MKKDYGIILNIVITILAILFAFIPIRYDTRKKDKRSRKTQYAASWSSLTIWGKRFAIVAVLFLLFSFAKIFYDQYINDKKDARIDSLDIRNKSLESNVGKLLKSNSRLETDNNYLRGRVDGIYSQNDTTQDLIKSQPKIKYEAKLELAPSSTLQNNPTFIFNEKKDSAVLNILITNLGNVEADKINDRCISVFYSNNKPLIDNFGKITNKELKVFPSATPNSGLTQFRYFLHGKTNKKMDLVLPSFIYFSIKYSSLNTNKSLNLVFKLTNNNIVEASADWYERVEKDLKDRDLW